MKISTRINCKIVKNDVREFPVFSAKINGGWYNIKFNKMCENIPTERGVYHLTFDTLYSDIDRGQKYVSKDGKERVSNDTIWIRKIDEIVKYTEEELAEMNAKEVEKVLGSMKPIDVDEPLPF